MPDLALLWLLGYALAGASMSWATIDSYQMQVQNQCSYTRYPGLCLQTMKEFQNHHPVDIMSALLNKTISETRLLSNSYFEILSSQLQVQEAERALSVTAYCKNMMSMSLKQLEQSLLALKDSPRKNKHDIQTWLSAALTFQQACKDSTESLGLSGEHMPDISSKMDSLSQLASNSLALLNRITGNYGTKLKNSTKNQSVEEESQGFPKWVSTKDRKLLQTSTIKANAVVAKDGTGNYKTISEAINAAPGRRFVIYVKSGVYKEKIRSNKDGITLIGDGKYSTVIVGDDSVAGGSSMPASATFS
ncbi:unnamed protein product [Dovyalis caffra]|uniref:Pectinesterase inhibitor domain-containing protein n=1 Tax=Dovyalis caffra TaxID=77055 RepID=A0AAV1SJ48_9ROSI|nr:unnamed protein product [Dovyalis caffra]